MPDALDAALEEATRRYVESNPESARLARAAAEVMPGGNTRSVLHTSRSAYASPVLTAPY